MPKQQPSGDPLTDALESLRKDYGKSVVVKLDSQPDLDVVGTPTGSLALDQALGVGGIPLGRVTEVYGPEGSGKSTLALEVVARAQAAGFLCAYVDAENAVSLEYAKAIGVDTDKLLFSQPGSGEEGLEITERLAKTGRLRVIVVDSVAALVPKAEIEGLMGDTHMGLQARLMSQALRKITATQSKLTAVIFINQLREKIGIVFGNPETTPGGKALKFYSSVRLDIRRTETLKDGNTAIGNAVKVKVVKNKVGPPLREAQFNIIFGQGIDWATELVDLGAEHALIERHGTFYKLAHGEPLGQGRAAASKALRACEPVAHVIRKQLLEDLAEGVHGPLQLVKHPDGPPTRAYPDGTVVGAKT